MGVKSVERIDVVVRGLDSAGKVVREYHLRSLYLEESTELIGYLSGARRFDQTLRSIVKFTVEMEIPALKAEPSPSILPYPDDCAILIQEGMDLDLLRAEHFDTADDALEAAKSLSTPHRVVWGRLLK